MSVNMADLLPGGKEVEVSPGKKLMVYALTLEQIGLLIQSYEADVREMLTAATPDFAKILSTAPALAVSIIAMGADALGQEAIIRKFPAMVQIEMLLDIWELTVPDGKKLLGRLEKLVGDVRVAQVQGAIEKLQTSLPSSLPASNA